MRAGLLIVLITVLMAGCASIAESKRMNALEAQQKTFTKAIRWGAYDVAAAAIKPRAEGENPVAERNLKRYEAIRVTAYDELGSRIKADQTECISQVVFHFYHAERGSVHKVLHTQVWWFDEDAQSWFLDGELPNFFAAMGAGE